MRIEGSREHHQGAEPVPLDQNADAEQGEEQVDPSELGEQVKCRHLSS